MLEEVLKAYSSSLKQAKRARTEKMKLSKLFGLSSSPRAKLSFFNIGRIHWAGFHRSKYRIAL